jgi:hypothetical protein
MAKSGLYVKGPNMKNGVVEWFAAICMLLPAWAMAQMPKSDAEIRAVGDKVMAALVKTGVKAAFAEMKPYVVIPPSEFESGVLQSHAQREQYGARYGKTSGYEFIAQKKVGESLVRLTYIEKTDKHALPWEFYFYKAPSGWVLNSFRWNDNFQQLF